MRVTRDEFIFYKAKCVQLKGYRRGVLRRLFAALALAVFCAAQPMAEGMEPVRIFALQRPDVAPDTAIPELQHPLVHGLSWRFRWQTLAPTEGQYHWEPIDQAIEVTSKAGKQVMLRIVAGMQTPTWVYQAGAKPFAFRNTDLAHPENYPHNLRMPIPWDEVYLAKWEAFIRAFGKRYNGHAHLYSVQMAGGGRIGEMNLPKAHAQWQQVGYTDDRLITAWKRIIDTYQQAFPNTPTNLDINEPLGGRRSNVLEPLLAYVLTTYPRKVYLQQNGLKADFPRESRIRQLLRKASEHTVVGYQMLGGKGYLDARVGDRWTAFRHALEDQASYVEVYASDVRDPGLREALQFLATPGRERPITEGAGAQR